MKTKNRHLSARSLFLARMVFSASALAPAMACAIDWSGTTGPFTTASNWTGGVVPSATTANILNGGTATITTGNTIGITGFNLGGHAGTGIVTQDGGAVTATKLALGGDNSAGGTGQGTYTMTGGTVNTTGSGFDGEMWVGSRGGTGTLAMSGNATITVSEFIAIGRDGASGSVTIGGTAELKNTVRSVGIGVASPGFSSTVTVKESGKLSSADELYVGWLINSTNEGILHVEDSGTVNVVNGLVVGRNSGKGIMTVSDSATINVGGYLVVGADGGSIADMTVNDNATLNITNMVWVSQNGATGTLTLNGGTTISHPGLNNDATGAGVAFRGPSGTLNLNGGVLETCGFNKTGAIAVVNFNGTTIKANGVTNTGSWFNNFGEADLFALAGGLKFDTNNNDVFISQFIGGAGGVTKSGLGTLVLTQGGYEGETVVNAGTLELSNTSLLPTGTVRIAQTGAVLKLGHNSVDSVDRLFIGGVQKPAGTYGAVGNEYGDIELAQLSGTGSLEVLSGPGSNTYQNWIGANAPATGFTPDSDNDGIPNGVEHVLGTNPNTPSRGLVAVTSTATSATFKHSLNPSLASDVTPSYQWSTNLVEWKASGATNTSGTTATITPSAPVAGEVTVTISITGGPAGKLFGRLAATQAP
ncbi:MAG: hypothetical protein EOP88_14055 [Verrucomicrobiaceae bacterium]|nr:MAG: hypothetical protein EOP88_14055 [Verrucomicrobiaceae bacterium]